MTIEEILKKRTNITFFREDKIPEKKVIDDILNQSHSLTPHKNNMYLYDVEVYGPEYDEDKKFATLATVSSDAKAKYRENDNPEDFKELEKTYEKWLHYHKNIVKDKKSYREMKKDLKRVHFNQQMRAPYLLVYSQKTNNLITDSQKESDYYKTGRLEEVFNIDTLKHSSAWLIQAGMHGIITSMFAIEKGLDVSFCKCYFYNTHIHSNILRKVRKSFDNIAFTLGIGYRDEEMMKYKTWIPKPNTNEIIKWQ